MPDSWLKAVIEKPPIDDRSTVSMIFGCRNAEHDVLAFNGIKHSDLPPSAVSAFLVEHLASDPVSGLIRRGRRQPAELSQLAGFDAGHSLVTDVIGSNGAREAVLFSAGPNEEGPSSKHIAACQEYVAQIEARFDVETQKVFTHATSMDLRDRENALQQNVAELRVQNGELDRMASYTAHELKTPLRALMFDAGYVSGKLAKAAETRPGLNEISMPIEFVSEMACLAQRMYDQSAQLSSQLDDLLFVVRSDHKPLTLEPIDLEGLVASLLERHRYDLAAVDGQIDLKPLPTVRSSPPCISMVLNNLISNAVRFRSPERRLKIGIFSEVSESALLLSVKDNGLGIAKENHERIFAPFQRISSSVEGLGLGLSLSVRLLDLLGAELILASEPDQGACFTIRLPQA